MQKRNIFVFIIGFFLGATVSTGFGIGTYQKRISSIRTAYQQLEQHFDEFRREHYRVREALTRSTNELQRLGETIESSSGTAREVTTGIEHSLSLTREAGGDIQQLGLSVHELETILAGIRERHPEAGQ